MNIVESISAEFRNAAKLHFENALDEISLDEPATGRVWNGQTYEAGKDTLFKLLDEKIDEEVGYIYEPSPAADEEAVEIQPEGRGYYRDDASGGADWAQAVFDYYCDVWNLPGLRRLKEPDDMD